MVRWKTHSLRRDKQLETDHLEKIKYPPDTGLKGEKYTENRNKEYETMFLSVNRQSLLQKDNGFYDISGASLYENIFSGHFFFFFLYQRYK